ncbi:MAG: ABC-2 family transporter protein [Anaerolineales bacterium]|nr:ABC-2 family transporter protein [Anaerolineales bacterium]
MRLFWELTKISFQRHLTYRAATVAGLVTNFFFGILRAAIFVALYDLQTEVEGITLQGAITYAALGQALIGYLCMFSWFELMNTVYTGDIASDLLKPMNYFSFWMAQDLGRAAVNFLLRGIIVMIGYAFIFDLVWPRGAAQIIAVAVSLVLGWLVSFSWRFLINLTSFWTPNARGILRFFFVLSWFFSGFLMPLRFFPEWVLRISYLMPFPHMFNTVIEIYLGVLVGPEMILALLNQVLWILSLILAGQIVLRLGVRRLVILGG